MRITRRSIISGVEHTLDLDITEDQVASYKAGVLVQDAFPNLSQEHREFIMSGITPEEWEENMKPPPDEDEGEDEEIIDPDDEDACQVCGGRLRPLGHLGRMQHFQCQNCGMQFWHWAEDDGL